MVELELSARGLTMKVRWLARVVKDFGSAHPYHAYVFATGAPTA
jgi:hypothetical protein